MSFITQSLCEVARTLEYNAQGLHHLWASLVSLVTRTRDFGFNSVNWIKQKIFNLIFRLMCLLRLAKDESSQENNKKGDDQYGGEHQAEIDETAAEEIRQLQALRRKKMIYNFIMKISLVLFGLTLALFFFKGKSIVQYMESSMEHRVEERLKAAQETLVNTQASVTQPTGGTDAFDSAFDNFK